jgi:hypothetical protein
MISAIYAAFRYPKPRGGVSASSSRQLSIVWLIFIIFIIVILLSLPFSLALSLALSLPFVTIFLYFHHHVRSTHTPLEGLAWLLPRSSQDWTCLQTRPDLDGVHKMGLSEAHPVKFYDLAWLPIHREYERRS